jgi:hypothetical protein
MAVSTIMNFAEEKIFTDEGHSHTKLIIAVSTLAISEW